jgi:hypothetical protein
MKRIAALAALALSGLIAVSSTVAAVTPPEPRDLTLQDLTRIEAAWKRERITNYRFTLERTCFCNPRLLSATFQVSGAQSRLVASNNERARYDFQRFVSAPKILAQMRATLEKGGRVAVVADPKNPLPAQITLDPLPQAADDELYLTISAFSRR